MNEYETLYLSVFNELEKIIDNITVKKYFSQSAPYLDLIEHYWQQANWQKFQQSVKLWRDFWLKCLDKEKKM